MFDPNAAIDQWLERTVAADPELEPHTNELADHLLSLSQALIADGHEPVDAFTQAVEALGNTTELANEFRKDGGLLARLRSLTELDRVPSQRQQRSVAAAWIVLSLFWAGMIIAVDQWVVMLWTVTTFLPLTAIGTIMNKQIAHAKAKNGCTKHIF